MNNNIELRHIADLATRSYRNNQFTFTDFLTEAQMSDFYGIIGQLPPCGYSINGGYEGALRNVIRFGNPEELGYEEPFPIVYVCIEPVMAKFSEDLTHRDVLGTIMNLGMEREKLGDIVLGDGRIWVVCHEDLGRLILDELTRIRHTTVKCQIMDEMPEDMAPRYEEMQAQVSQARLDAVVSKLCHISRGASAALFVEGKVAINGREMKNHSYILKENDIISVRGYGKFRFKGESGTTRKGNLIITVDRFA